MKILIQIQLFEQLGVIRFKTLNWFKSLFTGNLQLHHQLLKATTRSVSEKNQISSICERIIYIYI